MLGLFDEFDMRAFLNNLQLRIFHLDLQVTCGKGTAEHDFLSVLGDVDESASTGNAHAKLTHVYIACDIALG